jgi:hypothetical protein
MNSIPLRQRLDQIGLTMGVFAAVAGLFDSDVSRYCRGLHVAKHRVTRMLATIDNIEELLRTPYAIVPNMKNAQSVRTALENLKHAPEAERQHKTQLLDSQLAQV